MMSTVRGNWNSTISRYVQTTTQLIDSYSTTHDILRLQPQTRRGTGLADGSRNSALAWGGALALLPTPTPNRAMTSMIKVTWIG